ncbi:tryptophan-rich sensory protein [Legionella birminghamensis]|uniref:Tryptophan-rich sensory protein n=1 Tax=Legionella birminghamensis TaxID=28083 RepID=A0A378IBP2_9GAMM|nr:TspO/MBR family protein [Legionella birminghamensis]KTC74508.1 tryptophan-rich sensory protein [Legionella birminghamensis]STX32637.1 tryptophan-rich sensory protein [Legionella birminghamensis]
MKLVFWIVLFEVIGLALGLLTQANLEPWYNNLHKSSLTPPGFVFSLVWTLLYALLAVVAWRLSNHSKLSSKRVAMLFALQMLMNWAWTPLFFGLHWLIPSAIWLIALTCLNVILFIEANKSQKTIAWLLLPYILWLLFASNLNLVIALNN